MLLAMVVAGGLACAKTKLTISSWVEVEKLKEAVEAFEKINPNVAVTIRKGTAGSYDQELLTWAAGGVFPDALLMYDDGFATFAHAGLLLDLTRLVTPAEKATFHQAAMETCAYKGRLYGLPYEWVVPMVFYNKRILAQTGIPVPADDWSWDEFLAICRKTTLKGADGKTTQIGYSSPWGTFDDHLIPTWILANGGRFFNDAGDTCLVASDKAVKAIEWWRDLVNVYQVASRSALFEDNKAALQLMMRWGLAWLTLPKAKMRDNFGLVPVPFPTVGATDSRIKLATKFWCVSPASRNKKEALNLIRFLSSAKGSSIFAAGGVEGIPGTIGVTTRWSEFDKQFISQEPRGIQMMPGVTQFRKSMDILGAAVSLAVSNTRDARATMVDAAARINVILRRK